jgi:hypothetical protein
MYIVTHRKAFLDSHNGSFEAHIMSTIGGNIELLIMKKLFKQKIILALWF